MRQIGGIHEWLGFLGARTTEEADALLAAHQVRIDGLLEDVCSTIIKLWDSPGGEVPEVLQIARTALTEASGMLSSVRGRLDLGDRESA